MFKSMLRKFYLHKLRCQYTNTDITIISNNCLGGVMYHDLGQKFLSPTINLWIKANDYVVFCENLEYYMGCPLKEKTDNKAVDYPVGEIVPMDQQHIPIPVYFQHYKSFEEAKECWEKRKARINYNKLCFILEFYDTIYNIEDAVKFDKLPGKKLIITHREIKELQFSKNVTCYTNDRPIGKICEVDFKTGKRFLDEIDWVSFLNSI